MSHPDITGGDVTVDTAANDNPWRLHVYSVEGSLRGTMFAVRVLWVVGCTAAVLLYEKRGNVSLAGMFGSRSAGVGCGGEVERGLEEMISAMWTIEALNAYEYLPGVRIGLSLFDACEPWNDESGLRKMAEELSRFEEEAVSIGIITTAEMSEKLTTSGRVSDSDVFRIRHIISGDLLADITVQLLINLQWTNVSAAVFDSPTGMNSFGERASREGISVRESVLMNCSSSCQPLGSFPGKLQAPSVTVVIASFANIVRLPEKFRKGNIKLILAPTDFVFEFGLPDLPKDTIVCLPSMQDTRASSGHLDNILRRKDFFSPKPPVRGPLFVGTAATILGLLKPFRTALKEKCENSFSRRPCAPLAHFIREINANKTGSPTNQTVEISPDDVEEALKVLKIAPDVNDEMFLCVASVINGNASEDFAIFQVFNLKSKAFEAVPIMIKDDWVRAVGAEEGGEHVQRKLSGGNPSGRVQGGSSVEEGCDPRGGGRCGNPWGNLTAAATAENGTEGHSDPQVPWRYLTWVFVNTSVGLVGVSCTVSIMLFVMIKICRNECLESSPHFALLLMASVVLTYLSSLPFHVDLPEGFACGYRRCVPAVIFAVLLSLLLSRSLMLAFSEAGGEPSGRINGYLQSILSFFMIGVQVSITAQNWTFANGLYDLTCADVHDKHDVILTLVYDFLLLILLACVSPFIVRSKRNYKEGLLFSISVFFITIVWSAWISFYVLLPNEHKDAAVAVGLNSTASVLLLCVFIPQMYLMAAPLSPLDRTVLPSASHPDFRSTLALHDCTFGSYRNSHLGCTNPTFLSARPDGSGHPIANDDFIGEPTTPAAHQNN